MLQELGFGPFYEKLLQFLQPLIISLYGDIGSTLTNVHAFIVISFIKIVLISIVRYNIKWEKTEALIFIMMIAKWHWTHVWGKSLKVNDLIDSNSNINSGGKLYFQGILERPETQNENAEISHVKGRSMLHLGHHR